MYNRVTKEQKCEQNKSNFRQRTELAEVMMAYRLYLEIRK